MVAPLSVGQGLHRDNQRHKNQTRRYRAIRKAARKLIQMYEYDEPIGHYVQQLKKELSK